MGSTTVFDDSNAYAAKEPEGQTFFDDGREIELLHYIYSRSDIESIRGNPDAVLQAIDSFGKKRYLMNVGRDKARIVCDIISKERPAVMVELGGYIGYSAIQFGAAIRAAGGKRYFSLERNPEFGAVILALVDLAGLSDTVKVIIGSSDASIRRLAKTKTIEKIELMFLDHYKPAYTTDLKLCEELGLIQPGSVMVADNCIYPGNPPYLAYVRKSVQEKRRDLETLDSGGDERTQFQNKDAQQYQSRQGDEKLNREIRGRPELVYESEMVRSFEPTGEPDGIEITRCKGIDK